MKSIKLFLGVLLMTYSSLALAQEDQTAKANKMGAGLYASYLSNPSGGSYNFEGLDPDNWELIFSTYQDNMNEISVKKFPTSSTITSYYPDNAVFPCTYVNGVRQTHKAMKGQVHISFEEKERLVFIDEWVYVLTDWKDKDHYVIDRVLKKGEIAGMKMMKAVLASKKEGIAANHVVTLQNYLDEAFKKQQEMIATEDGKKKNDSYTQMLETGSKRWDFVRDSINGKYWNSAEGQAKQAEWSKKDIVLNNDTNLPLYLCYGSGAYHELKPGESKTFSCSGSGKVYRGTLRPNNSSQYDKTDNLLLDSNGQNCGAVIKASTVVKY
ncbi:MAG: hypothetical protein H6598_04215 [Flavobacteriales bacterium]|nr:hypothetical protein [Flavobacteriales bacterium]